MLLYLSNIPIHSNGINKHSIYHKVFGSSRPRSESTHLFIHDLKECSIASVLAFWLLNLAACSLSTDHHPCGRFWLVNPTKHRKWTGRTENSSSRKTIGISQFFTLQMNWCSRFFFQSEYRGISSLPKESCWSQAAESILILSFAVTNDLEFNPFAQQQPRTELTKPSTSNWQLP